MEGYLLNQGQSENGTYGTHETLSEVMEGHVAIWELEYRGMTVEESQAFKNEVERLHKRSPEDINNRRLP
jgi:hypothetical protein